MEEVSRTIEQFILVCGVLTIVALLGKSGLKRLRLPPLVGYILIGFALRLVDLMWPFLNEGLFAGFEFLANVGVALLLFSGGLGSNLKGLMAQMKRASVVWVGNVLVSGLFGYITGAYILGLSLIPTLFITVAFTATSIGVPLSIWGEQKAVRSSSGELLIDVAELDDISAIVLMAVLLAIAPVLASGGGEGLGLLVGKTTALLMFKLMLFAGACYLFGRFAAEPVVRFLRKQEGGTEAAISIGGIGIVVAALASLIGFSFALGAFFAGLVFSRDKESTAVERTLEPLYDTFTPFFFIGIGLGLDPSVFGSAATVGLVLLLMAVLGKLIGAGAPTYLISNKETAVLIAVSMVPRAEIAMVVVQQGAKMGEWAVSPLVFGGMIVVVAGSCIVAPLVLRPLLQRWPPPAD